MRWLTSQTATIRRRQLTTRSGHHEKVSEQIRRAEIAQHPSIPWQVIGLPIHQRKKAFKVTFRDNSGKSKSLTFGVRSLAEQYSRTVKQATIQETRVVAPMIDVFMCPEDDQADWPKNRILCRPVGARGRRVERKDWLKYQAPRLQRSPKLPDMRQTLLAQEVQLAKLACQAGEAASHSQLTDEPKTRQDNGTDTSDWPWS